jgi:hypothetical protein
VPGSRPWPRTRRPGRLRQTRRPGDLQPPRDANEGKVGCEGVPRAMHRPPRPGRLWRVCARQAAEIKVREERPAKRSRCRSGRQRSHRSERASSAASVRPAQDERPPPDLHAVRVSRSRDRAAGRSVLLDRVPVAELREADDGDRTRDPQLGKLGRFGSPKPFTARARQRSIGERERWAAHSLRSQHVSEH